MQTHCSEAAVFFQRILLKWKLNSGGRNDNDTVIAGKNVWLKKNPKSAGARLKALLESNVFYTQSVKVKQWKERWKVGCGNLQQTASDIDILTDY